MKIIYCIDGSDAVSGAQADVIKNELKRAIKNLSPVQAFNIVLAHTTDEAPYQSLENKLSMATPNEKAAAADFIDNKITFGRAMDSIPALVETFRERPGMIYILLVADHTSDSVQAIADKIHELNGHEKRVKVNVVLLINRPDRDKVKDVVEIMKKISMDNGGEFQIFTTEEIADTQPAAN